MQDSLFSSTETRKTNPCDILDSSTHALDLAGGLARRPAFRLCPMLR